MAARCTAGLGPQLKRRTGHGVCRPRQARVRQLIGTEEEDVTVHISDYAIAPCCNAT